MFGPFLFLLSGGGGEPRASYALRFSLTLASVAKISQGNQQAGLYMVESICF